MQLTIFVQEGPYNHQASDSAYMFVQAALKKGHTITGIFFYNDGVLNASSLMKPPQDDRHIAKRWSELGAQGIDLVACIAASNRRGISEDNLMSHIRISGLGQLATMVRKSDRLVTFGD